MSEGRIPWTAAFQYAENIGLDADEFEDLWVLISGMDAEYLKYRKYQADSKRTAAAGAEA